MPVYEFYCCDCHTIFSFLSRRVNTAGSPGCPKCGRRPLERRVSLFAYSSGLAEEADGLPGMDEGKLEKAMMALAGEMETMDENDPRAMAAMMRKMSDLTGIGLGSGFEEAMRRMEAGEDPEKIEEEMGDILESLGPLGGDALRRLKRKASAPDRDDTLYPMPTE